GGAGGDARAFLRVAGKREIGQLSTSDLIVILLISNTVQNAIIGNETSLIGGLGGATILILLNKGLALVSYRSKSIERLIDGEPVVLVENGVLLRRMLDRERISPEELRAAARVQNVAAIEDIRMAVLETTGSISIIPRVTGSDVTIEHRLERIESLLNQMLEKQGLQPQGNGGTA
ncbi:MAG TPA: DUF421 domain-containing protein, partial [Thermomicrobiales bacterium]|nr:DUF421 domain-containing protein [Thermomicrobiales bacterium]